ncbi:hypothetical protein NUKP65_33670 [Klebsiella variicola]|nr:hypothetical protein NUKP65_33670 [Klebsiella variicola]GKM80339.1 hypothetical protein NUKP68_33560 [Klebsiella variicola]
MAMVIVDVLEAVKFETVNGNQPGVQYASSECFPQAQTVSKPRQGIVTGEDFHIQTHADVTHRVMMDIHNTVDPSQQEDQKD